MPRYTVTLPRAVFRLLSICALLFALSGAHALPFAAEGANLPPILTAQADQPADSGDGELFSGSPDTPAPLSLPTPPKASRAAEDFPQNVTAPPLRPPAPSQGNTFFVA